MNPPQNSQLGRGVHELLLSQYKITFRTFPLSGKVTDFLSQHQNSIKNILKTSTSSMDPVIESTGSSFLDKKSFLVAFEEVINQEEKSRELLSGFKVKLAGFGPSRVGCNILLSQDNLLGSLFEGTPAAFEYSDSIKNGFQLAVSEGPLANEPVQGMCVLVESVHKMSQDEIESIEDPRYQQHIVDLSGRLITSTRDAIHEAFLDWSPRIMWAIYSCDIQTSVDVLGKVYAVILQRHGKIISEEMKEGTPFFQIEAHVPVVEAFGLSEDIRKRTSGAAQPQLVFSGFECIDLDPFWVPTTEEELEELGDTADRENIARKHMNAIRRRKGLFIEEKVVENAEKQRTLKKN